MTEIDLTKFAGHTPGPWEIDKNEHGYWQVADKQDAICCNSSCYAGYGKPELDAANARLIAAAPDLLAAYRAALARAEAAEKERDEWRQACLDHGEKANQLQRELDAMVAANFNASAQLIAKTRQRDAAFTAGVKAMRSVAYNCAHANIKCDEGCYCESCATAVKICEAINTAHVPTESI